MTDEEYSALAERIAAADKTRPEGFFWVRPKGICEPAEWTVARWNGHSWSCINDDEIISTWDFLEVHELKITEPQELWRVIGRSESWLPDGHVSVTVV